MNARASTPIATRVLGWITLLCAAVLVAAGLATYPTGHIKRSITSVPDALVATGVAILLMYVLDRVHARTTSVGASVEFGTATSPSDGLRTTLAALAGGLATVLGLVTAFNTSTTDAVRVGALFLVVAIFLSLVTTLHIVFDPPTIATLNFLSALSSVVFVVAGFGLACIGFAVFNR